MEGVIIQHNEKCNLKTTRLSYMQRISQILCTEKDCVLPTTRAEERYFDDALGHLVRLLPDKRDTIAPIPGTKLRTGSSKERGCRKERLKEILNALQFMQCERLYEPPADDEIRYYLLIKKYIRAMITFFSARKDLSDDNICRKQYECFTYSRALHNVDELVEINRYLADFSAFVSDMDIKNGWAIKPLTGIQENYEVAPIVHGFKERNTLFYWHKFMLAFLDLRSSPDTWFPPNPEEERSYLRLLDHISSPSSSFRDQGGAVNVYSEELHMLFLERIEHEVKDLQRHCARTRMSILEKLSLVESWESLVESYHNEPFESDMLLNEEVYFEMRGRLTMRCQVSREDLPAYIASVERCRDIARILKKLICAHQFDCFLWDHDHLPSQKKGWDALHTLTLFKRGSFSPGNVFREHIILRDSEKKHKPKEGSTQYEEAKMKTLKRCVAQEECEKENVKTLEGIVEDLRLIGDSDTRLDKEEGVLMYKIWVNIASSVHFFFCAMAYEQQSYIVARGSRLSHVRQLGVKTRKMMTKNSTNAIKLSGPKEKDFELKDMIDCFTREISTFSHILYHYGKGLREKLETQSGSKTEF